MPETAPRRLAGSLLLSGLLHLGAGYWATGPAGTPGRLPPAPLRVEFRAPSEPLPALPGARASVRPATSSRRASSRSHPPRGQRPEPAATRNCQQIVVSQRRPTRSPNRCGDADRARYGSVARRNPPSQRPGRTPAAPGARCDAGRPPPRRRPGGRAPGRRPGPRHPARRPPLLSAGARRSPAPADADAATCLTDELPVIFAPQPRSTVKTAKNGRKKAGDSPRLG